MRALAPVVSLLCLSLLSLSLLPRARAQAPEVRELADPPPSTEPTDHPRIHLMRPSADGEHRAVVVEARRPSTIHRPETLSWPPRLHVSRAPARRVSGGGSRGSRRAIGAPIGLMVGGGVLALGGAGTLVGAAIAGTDCSGGLIVPSCTTDVGMGWVALSIAGGLAGALSIVVGATQLARRPTAPIEVALGPGGLTLRGAF